jgi:hypothetical protein
VATNVPIGFSKEAIGVYISDGSSINDFKVSTVPGTWTHQGGDMWAHPTHAGWLLGASIVGTPEEATLLVQGTAVKRIKILEEALQKARGILRNTYAPEEVHRGG